jgi:hypothetical protein
MAFWQKGRIQQFKRGLLANLRKCDLDFMWWDLDCCFSSLFWIVAVHYHHRYSIWKEAFSNDKTIINAIWKENCQNLNVELKINSYGAVYLSRLPEQGFYFRISLYPHLLLNFTKNRLTNFPKSLFTMETYQFLQATFPQALG